MNGAFEENEEQSATVLSAQAFMCTWREIAVQTSSVRLVRLEMISVTIWRKKQNDIQHVHEICDYWWAATVQFTHENQEKNHSFINE